MLFGNPSITPNTVHGQDDLLAKAIRQVGLAETSVIRALNTGRNPKRLERLITALSLVRNSLFTAYANMKGGK
jgi:hypothetical protein